MPEQLIVKFVFTDMEKPGNRANLPFYNSSSKAESRHVSIHVTAISVNSKQYLTVIYNAAIKIGLVQGKPHFSLQ